MTGLFNRRYLEHFIPTEASRTDREGTSGLILKYRYV
jgi:PleD family two-component response regulator